MDPHGRRRGRLLRPPQGPLPSRAGMTPQKRTVRFCTSGQKRTVHFFPSRQKRTVCFCALLILAAGCAGVEEASRTLSGSTYLLRPGAQTEWEEFAGRPPHGQDLELKFEDHADASEQTLFVKQDNL